MVKKHEVIEFIKSAIDNAVNKDIIPIVDTEYENTNLIVTFTEINDAKDLIETKYRIIVEFIE